MLSGLHAAAAVVGRDLAREVQAGTVIAHRSRLTPPGNDDDPLAACRDQAHRARRSRGRKA